MLSVLSCWISWFFFVFRNRWNQKKSVSIFFPNLRQNFQKCLQTYYTETLSPHICLFLFSERERWKNQSTNETTKKERAIVAKRNVFVSFSRLISCSNDKSGCHSLTNSMSKVLKDIFLEFNRVYGNASHGSNRR